MILPLIVCTRSPSSYKPLGHKAGELVSLQSTINQFVTLHETVIPHMDCNLDVKVEQKATSGSLGATSKYSTCSIQLPQ